MSYLPPWIMDLAEGDPVAYRPPIQHTQGERQGAENWITGEVLEISWVRCMALIQARYTGFDNPDFTVQIPLEAIQRAAVPMDGPQ